MARLNISPVDCKEFTSGWSLSPDAVYAALKHTRYNKKLRLLEFGSGIGTRHMVNLLKSKNVPFKYIAYENNPDYVTDAPEVRTILWDWDTFPTRIAGGKFDLVIIDGPNGVRRQLWYPLLKKSVRRGTVMLIDDFLHYSEFKTALCKNFEYAIMAEYAKTVPVNADSAPRLITWQVVQVLAVKE